MRARCRGDEEQEAEQNRPQSQLIARSRGRRGGRRRSISIILGLRGSATWPRIVTVRRIGGGVLGP
jgi:hypothetical protein